MVGKAKRIMNESAHSGPVLAHTCQHCQEVVIQMPSNQKIEQARIGDWLPVMEIGALRVLWAASDGCAFFQWTIAKFQENEELEDLDGGWSLSGGFLERHLRDHGPDLPFIVFSWLHQGDIVYDLDWAALLAEQG